MGEERHCENCGHATCRETPCDDWVPRTDRKRHAELCAPAEVAKHAGPWSSHGALGTAADEVCDWIAGHDVKPDSTGAFMSARLLAAGYLRALRTATLLPVAEVRRRERRLASSELRAICNDHGTAGRSKSDLMRAVRDWAAANDRRNGDLGDPR